MTARWQSKKAIHPKWRRKKGFQREFSRREKANNQKRMDNHLIPITVLKLLLVNNGFDGAYGN